MELVGRHRVLCLRLGIIAALRQQKKTVRSVVVVKIEIASRRLGLGFGGRDTVRHVLRLRGC